jgi:iron complex outermembrane recepter protein
MFMKALKPLAAAIGAVALLGAAPALQAQNLGLEEIIVSAPMHKGEAETVHPLNILDGEDLRRKLASTLGETLKQELGVSFSSFGPGVGQPVIRGQGAPRVLVLQNSMPVSDASNTSADHANASEPVLAERIEVLRGPATLLYGSGAIGGVVNVIDQRVLSYVPQKPEGALEYRRGSNADTDLLAGRLNLGTGKLGLHLDGFLRDNDEVEIPGNAQRDGEGSRGVIENSDAEASAGTAGLSWVFGKGFIGLAVNRLENEYGVPPGAHGHHGHEEDGHEDEEHEDEDHEGEEEEQVRIDMEQTRYDLRSELNDPLPGVELLRSYLAYSDYGHTELENGEIGTTFGSKSWDGRIEAVHSIGALLHGAAGLQFHSRDFKAVGEEAFVPSTESDSWGVFVVEDLHRGDVVWEFGLRYNHDEHTPDGGAALDFDTFSASVSALWSLDEKQTLKFAVSAAERAPAMEELFSDGVHIATRSYELGDTALDEERSLNFDLGYHYHAAMLDFSIEAFYNQYADYIYQADTGSVFNPDLEMIELLCSADDEDECLPVLQWTATDADFYGIESELKLQLPANWHLAVFGDYVHGKLDGGASVPRLPPGRFGLELGWASAGWDLAMRVTEVLEQDRTGAGMDSVDGYTALSARAEYGFARGGSRWTLFLRGENLLDEEIRNASSLLRDLAPEPGLNVEAGVRLSF